MMMMSPSAAAASTSTCSPLMELDTLLQRMEGRLHRAKEQMLGGGEADDVANSQSSSYAKSFFAFRRTPVKPEAGESSSNSTTTGNSTHLSNPGEGPAKSPAQSTNSPKAQFIVLPEQESLIEDLRRIAELVVIGENYVTRQEKKKALAIQKRQQQEELEISIDVPPKEEEEEEENKKDDDEPEQSPDLADVFDLFFERNALATWVRLLRGRGFDEEDEDGNHMEHASVADEHKTTTEQPQTPPQKSQACSSSLWLPPFAVATQLVQSISILVQNVSRATSLYMLFSNDHINELMNLNLEFYEHAERYRRQTSTTRTNNKKTSADSIFASPEVAELSTHFVTFLKSLALRMNTETLQFFLQYPPQPTVEHFDDDHYQDETDAHTLRVSKFPLYDRALEFCAAHQDSFVRVTAMNICLNTIRLTTVQQQDDDDEQQQQDTGTTTPSASLHDAQALPFRERLAMAHYTCTPSRVERLIAPIFTKLSERWTFLDEALRAMDTFDVVQGGGGDGLTATTTTASSPSLAGPRNNNEKVAKVREKVKREKLVSTFREASANLQDELFLLEDVFKVGLTVLNEQMIEMMLATFVYPLLLQPLILFSQRYMSTVLQGDYNSAAASSLHCGDTLDHPFGTNNAVDRRDALAQLTAVMGPAKTALFTMAAAFQCLTNPPLLRLMFTALLHPISPDSTTVPTVRSNLQVAIMDMHGRRTIRMDDHHQEDNDSTNGVAPVVSNTRTSYPFGKDDNREANKVGHEEEESCVFVLAPALAEVLQFRGHDYGMMARTKPNSYRKAILQCLEIEPLEFTSVRLLAVCTLDAAISRLHPQLAADLLLGVQFQTLADDIPMDERNLDSVYAHQEHDRGLGGGVQHESRHSISMRRDVVGTNLVSQVVSPLVTAIVTARPSWNQKEWVLTYDGLAAHALLLLAKGGPSSALVTSSKALEIRRNQAAQWIPQLPEVMHRPMGGGPASYFLVGAPHVNVPDYDSQMYGGVMNALLHGISATDKDASIAQFLKLLTQQQSPREAGKGKREEGLSVEISVCGSFQDMTKRISDVFLGGEASTSPRMGIHSPKQQQQQQQGGVRRDLQELRESISVFFRVDALVSLLKDLAVSGGVALQQSAENVGIAFSEHGHFVSTVEYEFSKKVFAPISQRLANALLLTSSDQDKRGLVTPGATLHLAGYPAIPCVCEAPASLSHLFAHPESGIVAQGVTWQSLYLVFQEGWMIFAQPIPGGASGEGRVIGGCLLDRTFVDLDGTPVADRGASPARRLLFAHVSREATPPPLFLFDEWPAQDDGKRALTPLTLFVSHLDVWCENERACNYAYQVASSQIFAAKAKRGQEIRSFLAPGNRYLNLA